jgi:hypothetical protein
MVHLLTVGGAFQAKVISARLGSVGIVTSLRGGVDGPYPFGDVQVLVDESDLELARQLILADQVEAVYEGRPGRERATPSLRSVLLHPWVAVTAIVLLAVDSSVVRVLTF